MSRYEFFQRILVQLEMIQTALNTLRATIKEEIQSDGRARPQNKDMVDRRKK